MIRQRKIVFPQRTTIGGGDISDNKDQHTEDRPQNKPQKIVHKGRNIFLIQAGIFLFCCIIVGRARGSIFAFIQTVGKGVGTIVSQSAKSIVGQTRGEKPVTDEQGNINIALLGYGGEKHNGGYLTDAIIICSLNPEKGTMAMLSVPRDLYIKKPSGSHGRINSVFQDSFFSEKKNYDKAAPSILGVLSELTNISLHYYAFIDFAGFEGFIDTLGGVDIDVPEPIYDTAYPGANNSYVTFSLQSGQQHLDGETALRYARSRHSTSDYSRSLRQQAIIQGLLDKILSSKTLLSPAKIDTLYKEFTAVVHTNLSVAEILRGLPYSSALHKKSSRQIAACGSYKRQQAQAGCLLYTPPMEEFGGMSVQIPVGSTSSGGNTYKAIHSFVHDIVLNTDFLSEKPTIRVLNGINTGEHQNLRIVPVGNNVAVELVKGGFTIFDVGNALNTQDQTTITTHGGERPASIAKIHTFFPTAQVQKGTGSIDGPSITLTIGNDYASGSFAEKKSLPLYLQR